MGEHTTEPRKKADTAIHQHQQGIASHHVAINDVPSSVRDILQSPGEALDDDTRTFMEQRFGHDFSTVRVHTDAKASESAQEVNALAYTVGRDVVFSEGQYAPGTVAGKQLLAHELTHVVQQASGSVDGTPLFREYSVSAPSDRFEQTAHRISREVRRDSQNPSQSSGNSSHSASHGAARNFNNAGRSTRQLQKLGTPALSQPVIQRQAASAVTFEPEVITVSAKEKASLLSKAGWKRANVQFVMRDFEGEPLSGYVFFVEFTSITGEKTIEKGNVGGGGILTLPHIWLKPEGALRLLGAGAGSFRRALQGNASYKLSGENLTFQVQQRSEKGKISAKTKAEATAKLAAEGGIGVVKVSAEVSGTVGAEKEQEWEVVRALPALDITTTAKQ
jgi:hypothetical protein